MMNKNSNYFYTNIPDIQDGPLTTQNTFYPTIGVTYCVNF